eukprot:CAMPEP_0174818268 /NCGR_PEP_ID=MMETSP1107-20130205/933_1 /TAXON_ID=36770 /ORGANISM="Paraphysomonas vestita, Strain GFlagA" /LENGTH=71 /DNA_ID=CAMNT_0016029907 /DNA_START=38 /DNA_END=249 /DNA_ORIENTATION=+
MEEKRSPRTLEERITELEIEIRDYKRLHDEAEDIEMKKLYGGLIKSARDNLHDLNLQQQEERYIQNVRSGA